MINDWDQMNVLQEFKRKIKIKVYNLIRQAGLMLQNIYYCKFSDTNYFNLRHLQIRHISLILQILLHISKKHIFYIIHLPEGGGGKSYLENMHMNI